MMRPAPFPGPPDNRLVVYGSLAPGEANHHVLAPIRGQWLPCVVTGTITVVAGYNVLSWTPDGPPLPAMLFVSDELPRHWERIDEFEGDGYRRIVIPARVGETDVLANVYVGAKT